MKKISIITTVAFFSLYSWALDPSMESTRKMSTEASDSIISQVKKTITPFMKRHKIPGLALILYSNGTPYFFAFGHTDSTHRTPIRRTTIFEIGSISKIFTCLLLAQSIIDGRMHLSDPINAHIQALGRNKHLKHMTLEKLATHTSLLPFNAPENVISQKGFLQYVNRWHPATKRPTWCYSNQGVELLRIALEESYQESINDLLISRVLQPLGMAPLGTSVPDDYLSHCAQGYDKAGSPAAAWPPSRHSSYLIGSAAVRASAEDMLKFLRLALDCDDLPPTLRYAMHMTQTPHVRVGHMLQGLGWQIISLDSLKKQPKKNARATSPKKISTSRSDLTHTALFEKTGTTEGFHAYIGAVPGQKKGIVILMNHALPNGWKTIRNLGREVLYKTTLA